MIYNNLGTSGVQRIFFLPGTSKGLQGIYRKMYHAIKESHKGVCVGGRLFYCTTEAASLINGVIFCRDIRGNYATKSTVAECVKRL